MLVAIMVCCCMSVFGQASTTPTPPGGVTITKSVINLSKPNGGPISPGDILQVRATIFADIGNTRYDEVWFTDILPAGVTYQPNSRAIRTNEGTLPVGAMNNNGSVPRYNLVGGPFVESGAGSRGGYVSGTRTVTVTVGSGATDVIGGFIGETSQGNNGEYYPIQNGGLLIMATYEVMVDAATPANTTMNLGGGSVRLGNATTTAFTDYVFGALNVVVFPTSAGIPTTKSSNQISVATEGTFGRGTTRNGAALPGGVGLTYVTMATTDLGDGQYAIVKNSSHNDGAAGVLANEMYPQASGAGLLAGGWDVVGDHTGSINGTAGNAPAQGTTAGGYMLLVNAANAPSVVFTENLTGVCQVTPYEITYWMRNVCPNCNQPGYPNPTTGTTWVSGTPPTGIGLPRSSPGVLPSISVTIEGDIRAQSGLIGYDNPGTLGAAYPNTKANTWKFRRLYLTTRALSSFTFALVNNSPGGGGNDWALDDIRFSQVVPDLLNLGDPLPPVCPGTSVILRTSVSSLQITSATYNFYKWQRSTNNGASWTDVSGGSGSVTGSSANNFIVSLTVPGTETILANNGVLYRVLVATTAANLGAANVTGTCAMAGSTFKLNIVNSSAFCRPPVANNVSNEIIPNTAAATALLPLDATDQDGSITSYTISTLPLAAHGVLAISGTPVIVGQVITAAQAALLTFDPLATFVGNAGFNYFATDNSGFTSNTATVTIPVSGDNKLAPMANNEGAVLANSNIAKSLPPLSGSVYGTGNIASYRVLTIPTATQGVLTYFNGTSDVAIAANQLLTPTQAATLKFTPGVSAPNGTFSFSYQSTDSEGQNSASANFSITLITPGTNPIGLTPPVAENIINIEMPVNAVAQALLPLAASDADGTIASYKFTSIPTVAQGLLQYKPGGSGVLTAVTTALNLTAAEVATLAFTPNATFAGNISITYTATDNSAFISAAATVRIHVINSTPIANAILSPSLNRTDAARPIPGLSAFDGDGSITSYNIVTVPSAVTQGNLYYKIGGTGAVTQITAAISLTVAEAASLQFDPIVTGTATAASFTYTATDNGGLISSATTYTIPLQQYFPPVVQDVVFNRTEGTGTTATPTTYVPNTATWTTAAGIAVTHLNSPIASDVDGTIANYQILTLPVRATNGEGRLRFPCDAACKALLPNLFTQGCNGATAGAFSATFISGDDGCLPGTTQYRTNSDDPNNYVEIVNASVPIPLTLAQMNGLQFNPRNPTQGRVVTFDYTAVDNDGYTGNTGVYFIPVTGAGLTTPPYALDLLSADILNSAVQATVPTLTANDNADAGSINRYEIQTIPTVDQGVLYLCTPACTAVTNGQSISVANAGNLKFTPSINFTGTASFTYLAYDNDATQKNSNIAAVRLSIVSSGLPSADGKSATLVNTAPATAIPALSGSISGTGTLQSFIIHNVPVAASQGLLTYFNGTSDVAVVANQALTLAEASTLKFDPVAGFLGNVLFKYSAQTFGGVFSNPATYTIKVTDPSPNIFTVVTTPMSKAAPATNLTAFPLVATDNGSITSYQIRNLPPASAGVLRVCSGTCTVVTAGQVLTTAQASQLQFTPVPGYTGTQAIFNYVATDNKSQNGNLAAYSIPLADPFTISGTVFADGNGSTDNLINGTGTNVANQLYVSLVDAGVLKSTVTVGAAGLYTLPDVVPGTYTVVLHNIAVGSLSSVLPSNFVSTAEGLTPAGDGLVNGIMSVTVVAASITGANFGIDALPVAVDYSGSGWSTPPGTDVENVPSAAFRGTDAEDGTYPNNLNGRKVTLYPATGGTLYYNGVAITVATTITSFNNDLADVDPTAATGATTVSFQYAVWDNANLADPTPATITMGFGGIVLPVTGLHLSAEYNGQYNLLNWSTATEINTASFTVQRSLDGTVFTNVATLAAAGNSQVKLNYEYKDAQVVNAVVYYRVLLTDVDGKFKHSNVAVVKRNTMGSLVVFPNPVINQFFVSLKNKGEYNLELLNVLGEKIQTKTASISTQGITVSFQRQGQPAGLYLLRIVNRTTGAISTQKIQFE